MRNCSQIKNPHRHMGTNYMWPNFKCFHLFYGSDKHSLCVQNFIPILSDCKILKHLHRQFRRFGRSRVSVRGVSDYMYAYINFSLKEDAARDIKQLHNSWFFVAPKVFS